MDDKRVIDFLTSFIEDVDRYAGSSDTSFGLILYDELTERLPHIQRAAVTIEPGVTQSWEGVQFNPFWGARLVALRLRGIVEHGAHVARILGPAGPQLAAAGLHPTVWTAAAKLWDGGHRRAAIQAAATQVETAAQASLGRYDISGVDLFRQGFQKDPPTTGKPRWRFPGYTPNSQAWTSAHEGAMNFGVGCMQRIRNLATHDPQEPHEQMALEQLAALSVLARWVDSAQVETV